MSSHLSFLDSAYLIYAENKSSTKSLESSPPSPAFISMISSLADSKRPPALP
jgi:hypothetical protein